MITIQHPSLLAFGILGNIISFLVFLAPLPTFVRVYKKKSTEDFKSLPYLIALFSALLWIVYAFFKGNSILLITINTCGIIIEGTYIGIYITYASRNSKIWTVKFLSFGIGGFCTIVLLCHYLARGVARVQIFGWVCVTFSVCVFAAPLSIMMLVIRTKSVKYMSFGLSLCLTLTATAWFMYGYIQMDLYVSIPNVVGFVFGVAQMTLYGFYRKYDKMVEEQKIPENQVEIPVSQNNTIETSVQSSEDNICPEAEVEASPHTASMV